MKKILKLVTFCVIAFFSFTESTAQSTVALRGDTIRAYKQGDTAVMKVDSTLFVTGQQIIGRTFVGALQASTSLLLNDTTRSIRLNKPYSRLRIATPVNGMLIYEDSTNQFLKYEAGTWLPFGSAGAPTRFAVSGEDDVAGEARSFSGNSDTYPFTFDALNTFAVRRAGFNRILMNSGATYLYSPAETSNILISDALNSLSINSEANFLKQNTDSMYTPKRAGYTSNIHSTLTQFSWITKKYGDSLFTIASANPTLQQVFDAQTGEALMNKADTINLAANKMSVKSGEFYVDTLTATAIYDINKRKAISFTPAASAQNQIDFINAAAGGVPIITVDGSDINTNLAFRPKGDGKFLFSANTSHEARLQLYEDLDNGGDYITLRPTPSVSVTDAVLRSVNAIDTIAYLSDVRAGGGSGTYTFNNGLDNSAGTVGLGGSLGIDRTITLGVQSLILDANSSGGSLRVQGRNSSVMELAYEASDFFNQSSTTGTWSEIFSNTVEASLYARDNGIGIIRSVKVEGTGTTVTGSLKIVDGTQSNGYVFTSDGSGNGSWQAPTGGGYTTLAQFVGETNWTTGYINGSGDYTALALGSSGKVLTSNGASSAPTWETPGGASWNGLFTNATSGSLNGVTLSETATLLEHTGGTSTTTLPLISATTGHTFFIVNHGSGVLTVNRQSSDNISYHGSTVTTFNLAVGQSCSIMAMSSAWVVWLDGYNPSGGGLSDSDYGDITVSGGGTVMTFDYKRNMVYTTATGTDANITATAGTAYNLPAATLSTGRTIDVSGLNSNGDYVEFFNNETGFIWSFTGATVYDSDGSTAITELLANANSVIRRVNGKLMISRL